jgi:hypothetical protein
MIQSGEGDWIIDLRTTRFMRQVLPHRISPNTII